MLGLLIKEKEQLELQYVIKRELEELLLDLEDHRIDKIVKQSMKERYKVLFQLYARVAQEKDINRYLPQNVNIK